MNTNSDSSIPAHFPCDIDACSQVTLAVEVERAEIVSLSWQTYTSERASRAHRRIKPNQIPAGNLKRHRNIDSNK